jgi:hypothetical protein
MALLELADRIAKLLHALPWHEIGRGDELRARLDAGVRSGERGQGRVDFICEAHESTPLLQPIEHVLPPGCRGRFGGGRRRKSADPELDASLHAAECLLKIVHARGDRRSE